MRMWWMSRQFRNAAAGDAGTGGGEGGAGGGGTGTAGGSGQAGGGAGAKPTSLLSGGAAGTGTAAAGAGTGTAAAGAGEASPWLWNEGVPATGEKPTWYKADKYKSVAEQAAALPGLEAKLGPAATFFGAPEGGVYAPPALPAGLEGTFDTDAPLFKAFSEFAKSKGLSQQGFNELAQFYAQQEAAEAEAEATRLSESLAQLGANLQPRIDAIRGYVEQHAGAEGFAALDAAIGGNVAAFQALEKLISVAANDGRLSGGTGSSGLGFTRADADKAMFEKVAEGPNTGQRRYDVDAAHRQRVDEMFKKLYPGESAAQQVG